jgi:hypothetical protein
MDTLYACALKRTPGWLAIMVSIVPTLACLIGFAGLICEFVVAKQYVMAFVYFYVVISLTVNLITYDVSGVCLIRILRNHQTTGAAAAGEELSSSKSACKFDLVIAKTTRSMFLLSLPSLAAVVVYSVIGITNTNTRPIAPYDPELLGWNAYATVFAQLVLGLLFTRTAWISKTALDAEIMFKTSTTTLSSAASRPDVKERGSRMSQSPKIPSRNSKPESEAPVVVTVVDDSTSVSDGMPVAEMCALPAAEIV